MYTGRMAGREDDGRRRVTVETACPLDCPDTCSLAVAVEDGRIAGIDASARHDITAGTICGKVRRFGDRVYGEDRLLRAGLRNGPKGEARFRHVSWDEALDVVAGKLAEIRDRWGGEAILPFSYGGSNGLVSQDTADAQLFRRLGASRLARTVCAAPTGAAAAALYGRMPGVAYQDYRHARLIVIWGANPATSGMHLVPHVRAAQRDGAALVVIDPRRTPLARQADIHLPVRPGTDVAVALALHRFLFELGLADERFLAEHATGAELLRARAAEWPIERAAAVAEVDPELLERFAELYAETSPAVIRCGWGLERNRNGGNAVAAVMALPPLGGKVGVPGGGY
ncbi:MAG: molybdopterin-dependent oxidoreductase [Acidobacteria bacterium]|nr:molybdopterin-dependent oxidoreductase [Acidobacteriota bacterium]